MDFSNEFLSHYQKCLLEYKNYSNLKEKAHVERKCLVQMYSASLKYCDNLSVLHLLNQNLKEYSDTVDNNGQNIYNDRIKKILTNIGKENIELKSNLSNIDIKSIIKPLPCSKINNFTCSISEDIIKTEMDEFKSSLYNSQNRENNSSYVNQTNIPKSTTESTMIFKTNNQELPSCSNNNKRTVQKSNEGSFVFITAGEVLQNQNKNKKITSTNNTGNCNFIGGVKKRLGTRRTVNSKFVPPLLCKSSSNDENTTSKSEEWIQEIDNHLKHIDPKMIEMIKSEIMDVGPKIEWSDIAGLEFAKTSIQEIVVWPMLRPDIFTGLRHPPKGILLFGPPGTGKTLIGKCVASQSKSTFFSISASSLTSKWIGDGEKMVRALFAVARCYQPSVIFIDEIDSLLSQRSDSEHESSRRIKTEFLVQLDGATTDSEERLLLIGATNRPQELDEAARRRFVKRLYIPLPEHKARLELLNKLILNEKHILNENDFEKIATLTEGYSGADIKNLCSEASLGPIRSIDMNMIEKIEINQVRALNMNDFEKALNRIKSSVSPKDLEFYINWDKTYGSGL